VPWKRWGSAFPALLVAACQSVAATSAPLTGSWGGRHVGLKLEAEGGRLDYDCAAGTIDEPLRLEHGDRFRAGGTHSPGQGGPDRIGYEPPRLPATYEGQVRGDRMTLHVRVPSTGVELGPFTLRRGAEPILLRCL
jgi:hypothetical protein